MKKKVKVLAFAASSSTRSINKRLVTYAAGLLDNAQVEVLDLNDYELPLFSEDKEKEIGLPNAAKDFYSKIGESDAVIISFAEHNGSYTAAYKNIFDWCSRINAKVFQGKPMVFLSTSPGPGGAKNVLTSAKNSVAFFGGDLKAELSIPEFYKNFDEEAGVIHNEELKEKLAHAVRLII